MKMMVLSRILLIEFGVVWLAVMVLLARQVVSLWRRRRVALRLRAEDAVLLAGAIVTCGVYAGEMTRSGWTAMPGVSGVWVGAFGACCGLHLGMKAVRALR